MNQYRINTSQGVFTIRATSPNDALKQLPASATVLGVTALPFNPITPKTPNWENDELAFLCRD